MTPLRVAVIGCGHLGRFHATLLSQMKECQLVGVVDSDKTARKTLAEQVGTKSFVDYTKLFDKIDAAVLAVPTTVHTRIGLDLIENGIHLLVEKPLATTLADAHQLAMAADRHQVTLAVGHVERFNPVFQEIDRRISQPVYLEASRKGGFTFRSTDVGVVLDLMIHDLDLVLATVQSPIEQIDAVGWPVITQFEDIAEAHLRFRNGCVANLRASRVSPDAERRMFVHDLNRQLTVDFGARTVRSVERCAALQKGTFRAQSLSAAKIGQLKGQVFTELLPVVEYSAPEANPLADELQDFMTAVRDRRVPRVSGWDACRAMEAAERIVQTIRRGSAWPRTQPESVPRRAA